MNRAELAALLVSAEGEARRLALLGEHAALADAALARELKDVCLDAWSREPARAVAAAESLRALASVDTSGEVAALRSWAEGVAALVGGQMVQSVARLNEAESRFRALCLPHTAAETQVSKLVALAMLGRYDEAVETGLRARDVFLKHGDQAAAGRVEHNIGNLCGRRDSYEEAERYLSLARSRFLPAGDPKQLAVIENSLAYLYTLRHDFRSAEQLYGLALERAEGAGLAVTQAEIEASMGSLALFQGRYDRALELTPGAEARSIYRRVGPTFAELGMRAEQARALAQAGRAAVITGAGAEAHDLLERARTLYAAEGNLIGEAYVTLTEAQLRLAEGDHASTAVLAAQAEEPLARAGVRRRALLARWLRGEAARAQGQERLAHILLDATLRESEREGLPQIAERCHTSLGLLAAARGDASRAEKSFK